MRKFKHNKNYLICLITCIAVILVITIGIDNIYGNAAPDIETITTEATVIPEATETVTPVKEFLPSLSAQNTKELQEIYFQELRVSIKRRYSSLIGVYVTEEERASIKKILELPSTVNMLKDFSKIIYRECRGESTETWAAVIWTILNRYDAGVEDTIEKVYKAKYQFAFVKKTPVLESHYEIAKDVYTRWLLENRGYEDVGRVLPENYLFFAATKARVTRFRTGYRTKDYWDWSLPTPYET